MGTKAGYRLDGEDDSLIHEIDAPKVDPYAKCRHSRIVTLSRNLCLGIKAVSLDGTILKVLRPLQKSNTGCDLIT